MENKEALKGALISAVTRYDAKESTKRGYNRNALGIYFVRIDDIIADVEAGASPRDAIIAGFTGKLQDACLRAIGQSIAGAEEQKNGWSYSPASLSR